MSTVTTIEELLSRPRIAYSEKTQTHAAIYIPIQFDSCTQWEEAHSDLDEIHRQVEVGDGKPFHGRRYLIHSEEYEDEKIGHASIDFMLERVPLPQRWEVVVAVYAEDEKSPLPYREVWIPPQSMEECDLEELSVMPGACFQCQQPSQRECIECGTAICSTCVPFGNMCTYCTMEHAEL